MTGVGLVTPLGIGTRVSWDRMLAGESAVGPIRKFDASTLKTQVGGEVADFKPEDFVKNRRSLRMMTPNDQLSVAGATLAMQDAGLEITDRTADRAGLFVGSNKEISNPMHLLEGTLVARAEDGSVDVRKLGESAASSFYPLFYVEGLQAASLFYISQAYGLRGANTYFAGMAEAGAVAIGRAYRAIRRGEADVAIAGGFDDAISWWTMTKFDAFGILTDRNELGAAACRPYDRDRGGMVLGEGAACLILEPYEDAKARGAQIYAEIVGFGSGYDGYKLVTPHPEGRGLASAMASALREAQIEPGQVGYIATEGNGTVAGDASEAHAIRELFGANGGLCASSVKGATGHLVAGAGALNAAVAALTLRDQKAPPTLNLDTPDPACALDWVPGEAREVKTEYALALARGLEGQNVALALRAVS
ncbi:MAG: beta-ketoacyl-[acyl-carrier-protein] synthase family protein [Chloroflexota bacterium]